MTPDGCSCLSCAPLYPTRPYEGAFVSTTNTIWKYLDYHKKLTLCRFYSVSAEAEPMCGVPDRVNNEIKALWLARQKRSRIHTGKDTRSHFLSHTCVVDIDPRASVVTLYNYRYHVDVVMPFRLMLLDLPLKAPDFVRASGLHRESNSHVWHDTHVPSGSRNVVAGSVGAHEHGGKDSSDEWFLSCRRCVDGHAATQANGRLVAATPPLPESVYEDELSFVDVDEHTLKHRRYDNIFALGDVAGLPTLKSYGAVFAQVPVVRHNVLQVLSQPPPRHGKQVGAAPDGREACAERGLARYDGYSSFHVIMTTWRAMWPEVRYNAAQRAGMDVSPVRVGDWAQRPQQNEPYEGDAHKLRSDQSFSAARAASNRLEGCNYHLWNNLHWRGVGGFVNALYYQTSLYEMMYFFLFMRGLWHPPSWFVLPAYSSTDGTPVQKSSFLTSWL